jgi:hypothetical protein
MIPQYLTYWSYLISFFSIIASISASQKSLKFLQKVAVLSTEFAVCLNLFVTIMFWGYLAQAWDTFDAVTKVWYAVLHTVPIVTVTINVIVTDMILIREDWIYMYILGLCYIPFNYLE